MTGEYVTTGRYVEYPSGPTTKSWETAGVAKSAAANRHAIAEVRNLVMINVLSF